MRAPDRRPAASASRPTAREHSSATGCTLPPGSGATATLHVQLHAFGGRARNPPADRRLRRRRRPRRQPGVRPARRRRRHRPSTSVSCAPLSVAGRQDHHCTHRRSPTRAQADCRPTGAGDVSRAPAPAPSATCTLTHVAPAAPPARSPTRPRTPPPRSPRLTATYDGDGDHFASSASALLHVPATGTPAVSPSRLTLSRGHIRICARLPEDRGVLPGHGHRHGPAGNARRRQRPDRRRRAHDARAGAEAGDAAAAARGPLRGHGHGRRGRPEPAIASAPIVRVLRDRRPLQARNVRRQIE